MSQLEKNIKEFYDVDGKDYKYRRWERNPIMKFDYQCTKYAIEQALEYVSGKSVLEIGPGPGTWTEFLVKKFEHVEAVEISATMIEQAKQSAALQNVVFNHTNFSDFESDKEFDVIISVRSFEYFDDKEEFIEKAYDLLKPNGFLIILTKTSRSYWFGRTKIRTVLQKITPFLFKYEAENLSKESKEKITLFKQKRVYPSKLKQLYKDADIEHKYHFPVIVRPPIFMRGKTEVPFVPPMLEKPVLFVFTLFDKVVRMLPFASFFAEGFIMVGRKS